jgi:hypothetical protein
VVVEGTGHKSHVRVFRDDAGSGVGAATVYDDYLTSPMKALKAASKVGLLIPSKNEGRDVG